MRALPVTLAIAFVVAPVLAAAAPAAAQVKVAVVGFTGDLDAAALSTLAVDIRSSLQRQVDPKLFIVVSREEMGAIYQMRGAPCRPDDFTCIVEASEQWGGRLFIRGVVRSTSDGIVASATLESVRGVLVAAAQTPLAKGNDVAVAVPILVRELLEGEKAYRKRAATQPRHPGDVRSDPAADAATPTGAVSVATGPLPPVKCKCLAIASSYVAGELIIDDSGLHFDDDPKAGHKLTWRYNWDKITDVQPTAHGANPALTMKAKNGDELVVYFNLGNDRNACLGHINQRKSNLR
jgi:hypothetical protein